MTTRKFRHIALRLPETAESSHMNHPDFRVCNKIFATLGYPDDRWGMIKLTPEQQQAFIRAEPGVFNPCSGAWGRRGATNVRLAQATEDTIRRALTAAWRNIAPEGLTIDGPSGDPNHSLAGAQSPSGVKRGARRIK